MLVSVGGSPCDRSVSLAIILNEAGIFHLIVEPELNLYNGLFLLSLPYMTLAPLLSLLQCQPPNCRL